MRLSTVPTMSATYSDRRGTPSDIAHRHASFQIEFALPRNSIENLHRIEGGRFTHQVHKLRMATHSIILSARLFWHPGCVVRNHEPAVAALFVNLRLGDGKAESLTALVFAFDAHNAGCPRRRLIDVDVRRSFRR